MRRAPACTQPRRCTPAIARTPTRRYASASTPPKDYSAQRTRGFGLSVFSEFTPLAVQHKAVNLGQGFPDFHAPDFVIKSAQKAIGDHINQYTRSAGHLRLVNALSKHFSPLFGRTLDPLTEVTTTVGATQGIFATMQAVINPGEEAIVIEPFYDSYPPSIEMAGGVAKFVSLRPPRGGSKSSADWTLDLAEVERTITKKTKLIIVNNPSNIPGKVFTKEELTGVADLAKKHDLLVLSDEVYEAMVYAPNVHTRIATLPGMWDRTITLGSAGKSFSVTGHKVGWAVGPRALIGAIASTTQWITFCVPSPLQEAIAVAFEEAPARGYWAELTASYTAKRSALLDALNASRLLTPVASQGSYFVLADFSRVPEHLYVKAENQNGRTDAIDYQFCRWLTKEVGVAAIPLSPFYSSVSRLPGKYARFTFCKRDEVIADGAARLKKLASMKV